MKLKTFKTIVFGIGATLLLCSCQKEIRHMHSGDSIRFTAGSGSAETKAAYSGVNSGNIERIDWKEGDTLRIYCDAVSEPAQKFADYVVTKVLDPDGAISYAHIGGTGGVGLRWGTGDHTFYAVYPSPEDGGVTTSLSIGPYADGGTKASVSKSISGATVTAKLPASQKAADVSGSGTLNCVAAPDLKNMLMTAKSATYNPETGIPDGTVFLAFTPLTTAVQFTITNQTKAPLVLKSVSLTSASSPLNGPFSVDIDDESHQPATVNLGNTTISYIHTYPYCQYTGGAATDATRTVTINFTSPVTLAYDADPAKSGKLTFTFFLQPCQNFDDLTFKLVKDGGSWMSTRLGYTDGSGILFPRFKKTEVKGVFVPEGAQWTVKYGPVVEKWNDNDEPINPAPEIYSVALVTPWTQGTGEFDIDLKKYNYVMNMSPETFVYDKSGTLSTSLTVTSTRALLDETPEDTPWKMEYQDNEGKWQPVLNGTMFNGCVTITDNSPGATSGAQIESDGSNSNLSLSVAAAEKVPTTHSDLLQAAPAKGTSDYPYDLSLYDVFGASNPYGAITANCYVVSSPGYYAFPIVYGNAFDYTRASASGWNRDSYSPFYGQPDGTDYLASFHNANDVQVSGPFIEEDFGGNASEGWTAEVLSGSPAVSNVTVIPASDAVGRGLSSTVDQSSSGEDSPCGFIYFEVSQTDLAQGNALVALEKNEKVVWSWHIWITDDLNNVDRSSSSLGLNIGRISPDEVDVYEEKIVKIRLVQLDSKETKEYTITRKGATESSSDESSYMTYQWGRKDPFPKATTPDPDAVDVDLGTAISNPQKAYSSWNPAYKNLWDATNVGNCVKSIYDPSPAGYRIPDDSDVLYSGAPADLLAIEPVRY